VKVSRRFADLKGVELSVNCSKDPVQVYSDPYALQHVVFLGFERALEAAEAGDEIELIIQAGDGAVQVVIKGPACINTEGCEQWTDLLTAMVSRLPGEVMLRSDAGSETFELTVSSESVGNAETF
jgi:hypothetical protein